MNKIKMTTTKQYTDDPNAIPITHHKVSPHSTLALEFNKTIKHLDKLETRIKDLEKLLQKIRDAYQDLESSGQNLMNLIPEIDKILKKIN